MYTVFQQFSHTFINFIPLLSIPFLVRDTKYERAVEYYGYLRITPLNRLLKTGVWFENYWADVESRLDNATYQSNLERGSQRKTESIVEEAMDYVRNC
jgi:hypothetical protein